MKKEDLLRLFGSKLIDAILQEMADRLGIPEQALIDSIGNRLVDAQGKDKISDYSWMTKEE